MDRIEYITIATLGDAQDFGDLTANGTATDKAGLSSPTRALFAGGEGPSYGISNRLCYYRNIR